METKPAVASLSALAHERRISIFRLLVQAGPDGLPAGEIARRLDMLPNTLSAALNILSQAELVTARRDGRSIIYTPRYDTMRDLLDFLTADCCAGSPEICPPLAATDRCAS